MVLVAMIVAWQQKIWKGRRFKHGAPVVHPCFRLRFHPTGDCSHWAGACMGTASAASARAPATPASLAANDGSSPVALPPAVQA
eukprot:350660-Chlamydomonas_euryale.AAC.5